jgi:hypothetical protein
MMSAPWLNELLISIERRYLDRLDFAVEELRRLGWTCQCSKAFDKGSTTHVSIMLSRVVEMEVDNV